MTGEDRLLSHLHVVRPFLSKNSIEEHHIASIENILNTISFFTSLIYKQKYRNFQRLTVNKRLFKGEDKRIEEIALLKNPPVECVTRFGRANMQKQSIFYATFDILTAFSELRPEIGDRVTVSTWQLVTDYDLSLSSIFKNTTKDGIVHNEKSLIDKIQYEKQLQQYDSKTQKQLDILVQFMADCFAKEVEDTNHFDYYLSAYFADRILQTFQAGEVDGFLYPSVRQELTLSNIALKPNILDANYKPVLVEESIVSGTPTLNGGWILRDTIRSENFQAEKVIWE